MRLIWDNLDFLVSPFAKGKGVAIRYSFSLQLRYTSSREIAGWLDRSY